jgi:hypothetical protein
MTTTTNQPSPTGTGTEDIGQTSVGQLISDVSRDVSELLRQEIELAKAELKQEAAKAGKGAGLLGGATFAGYLVVVFLSLAAWAGLGTVMPVGWAALVVAVIWAVIGSVMYVTGRSELRQVSPKPERTVETMSEIPSALRGS